MVKDNKADRISLLKDTILGVRTASEKLSQCRQEMEIVKCSIINLSAELKRMRDLFLVPALSFDMTGALAQDSSCAPLQYVEARLENVIPWFANADTTNDFLLESISSINSTYEGVTDLINSSTEAFPQDLSKQLAEIKAACQGVIQESASLLSQLTEQRRHLKEVATLANSVFNAIREIRAGRLPKATVEKLLKGYIPNVDYNN